MTATLDPVKWGPDVLEDVKSGDLPQLQAQLADFEYDRSRYDRVEALVKTACEARQVDSLRWLINERFPTWDCSPDWDAIVHTTHLVALGSGPAVYDVFLTKWPLLRDTDLEYNGNPLGFSIFADDRAMVKYLLEKGADPNQAHYSCRLYKDPEIFRSFGSHVSDDILKMMIAHGFKVPVGAERARKKPKSKRRCIMS